MPKSKKQKVFQPELGERTLAMPNTINIAGTIFGGHLLSVMDLSGCIICRKYQNNTGEEDIVTVQVTDMTFSKPIYVGDTIECWVQVLKLGKTSITTYISVNVIRRKDNSVDKDVANGIFKYVNTKDGKAVPLKAVK